MWDEPRRERREENFWRRMRMISRVVLGMHELGETSEDNMMKGEGGGYARASEGILMYQVCS